MRLPSTLTESFQGVPMVIPIDGGYIERATSVRTVPYEDLYRESAALMETPAEHLQRGVEEEKAAPKERSAEPNTASSDRRALRVPPPASRRSSPRP